MTNWQLAQINIAEALFPLDDPHMADFMNALDDINALAEASPGFIWRLQSNSGNATDIKVGDNDRLVINMSVWRDVEALKYFAYESGHRVVLARRRDWFETNSTPYQALWWVKAGKMPSAEDGIARLEYLRINDCSGHAFNFKNLFPAPEEGDVKTIIENPSISVSEMR